MWAAHMLEDIFITRKFMACELIFSRKFKEAV